MRDRNETLSIAELMEQSGVQFGTSGARGLAAAMSDRVCYAYTAAFLQYLERKGEIASGGRVAVAGDFRPSTPRIMTAAARAISDRGYAPVNCGFIPTPAVALYGIQQSIPSLMVTGSHIPDDRNGIKFNKAEGEILKADEEGIRQEQVSVPNGLFNEQGGSRLPLTLPPESGTAYRNYRQRYLDFFPEGCLKGRRIGLYEHSSVARQVLGEVLEALGAELIRLGYSDEFIPVDTEAIRPEDVDLAHRWTAEYRLDALVSTDGDGDRPLVSDEQGNWLRGDVAGVLCARYLEVRHLVTPVSSNTLVEKSGWFERVDRTRIGSPYVIAAMDTALVEGRQRVAGYEANGGFLTADSLQHEGATLSALPTRDAVIVVLAVLMLSVERGLPISGLLAGLPARYTSSDRLKAFPSMLARERIALLRSGDEACDCESIESLFGDHFGRVATIDDSDGLRITFQSDEVVHLRPSGNAPELRCYNEAATPERARQMNRICLEILEGWRS